MRGWLLALLLLGAAGLAQGVPPAPTAASQKPGPVTSATLLDGQRLTINVAFAPGSPGGPAYPPLEAFSKAHPAYYPLLDNRGPFRLSVLTQQPRAALVLRARSVPEAGQADLPTNRIEYRVNGGRWQAAQAIQVIALLPKNGMADYNLEIRLRLEGDETAGVSQVLLTWSVEAQ